LRFGNRSAVHPEGWQLDIEGAGMPRLDLNDGRRDLNSADFRFGVPLTYGIGRYQMKFAYYHLSSHLGDELLLRTNIGDQRINYVRDAVVWGHSYFLTPEVRSYLELAYSFNADGGAEPWEIQFGLEYAPPCPTGRQGAPFVAVNALLQQERDFGGISRRRRAGLGATRSDGCSASASNTSTARVHNSSSSTSTSSRSAWGCGTITSRRQRSTKSEVNTKSNPNIGIRNEFKARSTKRPSVIRSFGFASDFVVRISCFWNSWSPKAP